jgi:hypothetical protein
MRSPVRPLLLSLLVPLAAACQDSATLTAPGPADATGAVAASTAIAASFEVEPQFNPQPEPPGQVLQFEAEGSLERAWVGVVRDPATGVERRLEVVVESVEMNGRTLRLAQVWILHPPDPIIPPDPIRVALQGTLNLANGLLVLNGIIEDGLTRAHVRGEATVSEGSVSALGELMFNPQPEPPGLL